MGKITPLKQFAFTVEINGLDQFVCQELTLPEKTVEEAEHTEGNFVVRTPALTRVGDFTLSNLKPADTAESWAIDLINSVQNPETGVGGTPADYELTIVIRLKDNGGNTITTYEATGCWCKKAVGFSLSKTASDNIMEEVQFVCNGFNQL